MIAHSSPYLSANALLSPFASVIPAEVAALLSEETNMTERDLQSLLLCIDAALDVYRKNEGKLNTREIRLKSMLAVVRAQVAEELAGEKAG